MDKREFIQRYMIQNYDINMYHDIDLAINIYNAIEEKLAESVNTTNLWDYNDK
jgi:hypothetical protein